MKVYFKGLNKFSKPKQIQAVKDFVKYLQTELPLKDNVYITFKGGRDIKMTTGVRRPGSQIFVLADKRLMIDILRTVSHEWVHEFQHQKMGLKGKVLNDAPYSYHLCVGCAERKETHVSDNYFIVDTMPENSSVSIGGKSKN